MIEKRRPGILDTKFGTAEGDELELLSTLNALRLAASNMRRGFVSLANGRSVPFNSTLS